MFAVYPEGGKYGRHEDNPWKVEDNGRRITNVFYMNSSWKLEDGGLLRLFLSGDKTVDILPSKNRMVLFWSDIPHEVLPTSSKKERLAFTMWFHDHKSNKASPKAAYEEHVNEMKKKKRTNPRKQRPAADNGSASGGHLQSSAQAKATSSEATTTASSTVGSSPTRSSRKKKTTATAAETPVIPSTPVTTTQHIVPPAAPTVEGKSTSNSE